jgi:hypothetical protein
MGGNSHYGYLDRREAGDLVLATHLGIFRCATIDGRHCDSRPPCIQTQAAVDDHGKQCHTPSPPVHEITPQRQWAVWGTCSQAWAKRAMRGKRYIPRGWKMVGARLSRGQKKGGAENMGTCGGTFHFCCEGPPRWGKMLAVATPACIVLHEPGPLAAINNVVDSLVAQKQNVVISVVEAPFGRLHG